MAQAACVARATSFRLLDPYRMVVYHLLTHRQSSRGLAEWYVIELLEKSWGECDQPAVDADRDVVRRSGGEQGMPENRLRPR